MSDPHQKTCDDDSKLASGGEDVATSSTGQANAAQCSDQTFAAVESAEKIDVSSMTVADLSAALTKAQTAAETHYEALLRAAAEAENARRRAQEEVSRAHKYAIERFAEYLLPVMDSLHSALADSSADVAKMREGIELTQKQLAAAFEKGRIAELNPLGEKFDPHSHQAISMVPADQEPNTVVTVLQRGYRIADRTLRPALVTVAQEK